MKQFSKIMLFVIGFVFVAFVVTSLPQRVKADHQENSSTRNHVLLNCTTYDPTTGCTAWTRTLADGSTVAFTSVPPGENLVITDFEFNDISEEGRAGGAALCTLDNALSPNNILMQAYALGSPAGQLFALVHSETGVAVENIPIAVCFNIDPPFNAPKFGFLNTPNILVRGYMEGMEH
jgi:hypothetical protein